MNLPAETAVVIHRVNTVARLRDVPARFGAEIDIRADGSRLYLNHEPFASGESLTDFLDAYAEGDGHGLLVLNIKEAGIETEALRLTRERAIRDHFLLDVEFPYLYRAARAGERAIAVRYSEDEPIELAERYRDRIDWVWIDTISRLPLDAESVGRLRGLKTCLVCPERWGRPADIAAYREAMGEMGFTPDAVMTAMGCVGAWE